MAKLKPSRPKKPNPDTRKIMISFKINSEEMRHFLARAHGYTEGNVSEWCRKAALTWKPSKEDLEK